MGAEVGEFRCEAFDGAEALVRLAFGDEEDDWLLRAREAAEERFAVESKDACGGDDEAGAVGDDAIFADFREESAAKSDGINALRAADAEERHGAFIVSQRELADGFGARAAC